MKIKKTELLNEGQIMVPEILKIEQDEDIIVIRLVEKKMYQHAVAEFQEKIKMLLDQGVRFFVVDLSGVEVMNSSAIGVLILLSDSLRKQDGKMVVTAYNNLLKELFQRMRLDSLFPMIYEHDQAVRYMKDQKKIPAP